MINIFTGCAGCGCGGCLSVLGIFALVMIIVSNFFSDIFPENVSSIEHASQNKIAVIPIDGVIVSRDTAENIFRDGSTSVSKEIVKKIEKAETDDEVRAIVINLNTPGGEVVAADEIYHALKQCSKPVVAYMNSIAASGGYYIACGAKKIIANKYALTGSIGVIMEGYNYSDTLDFLGIEPKIFTSGKMKAMLNGALPPDKDQEFVAQRLIDETFRSFVEVVAHSRNIPEDKILKGEIGDGRIFSAAQARELKLIDDIGYFEDAVNAAAECSGLKKDNFSVDFDDDDSLLFTVKKILKSKSENNEIQLSLPVHVPGGHLTPGTMYMLPAYN